MRVNKKIEVEEVTGMWVVTEGDQSQAYSQSGKDYVRLLKDLIKRLELGNILEVKERGE